MPGGGPPIPIVYIEGLQPPLVHFNMGLDLTLHLAASDGSALSTLASG